MKYEDIGSAIILLSTYNGSKYIFEQIQSILKQDFKGDITIFVRDDGSSDDTLSIIQSISCPVHRRIEILQAVDGTICNLGPQRSFLALIDSVPDADYYFLSDQDDKWKSDHVSSAARVLRGKEQPTLYCSNYSLVNAELNGINENVLETKPQFTPLKTFFYNKIPGCCMAWNSELQKYLSQMHPKNVMMHDRYIASFASFVGEIIYDPQSHIFHRIHGDNVIGIGNKKIEIVSWLKEKGSLLRDHENYDISEMAAEFLRVGQDVAHPEYIKDIELLRDYRESRKKTQELLNHPDTFDHGGRSQMSIRSKIRLRLF